MKLKIPQLKKLPISHLTIAAVFLILILPFIAFADTNPYSDALKGITTLLFIAFFTLFAAITFVAIAVMLFIRYIALTILLILSPLVWLFWIFPSTKEYWSKWWHNFLKWAMFLPAVLFFLYLTVATIGKFPDTLVKYAGPQRNLPNQGFAIDVAYIADLVAILGLLIGGLYTANALGIYGAKTFYGMAQGSAKMFGSWVGRKLVEKGTGWLRKPRGEPGKEKSYVQRMSEWSAKHPRASRWTGAGLAIQGVARLSAAGGENLVQNAMREAAKRSANENIAMLGYVAAPTRQGILAHLQAKDLLDKMPDLAKYIDKKYKAEAARFGQAVTYSKIEKAAGINVEMKEAFNQKRMDKFFEEGQKFFAGFAKKDWTLPMYNDIYTREPTHGLSKELHEARKEGFAYGVATNNPGDAKRILTGVKSKNFDEALSAISRAGSHIRTENPARADEVLKALDSILAKRLVGELYEEATTPGAAPEAPAGSAT